jgi:hypothetical protein
VRLESQGFKLIMVKSNNELLEHTFPYKQASEEFAELKIRDGSLRHIYKSIMDYYYPQPKETRGFKRLSNLEVDGIIKRGDLWFDDFTSVHHPHHSPS